VRLLLITPKVDPEDDLFGHVHSWVMALARRVERLDVVALWGGEPPLPANVRFTALGKDRRGPGGMAERVVWLARLERLVARLCLGGRVDAILAHMAPVFAVAAAPAARLADLPVFLWYAHGHVSPMLRLAHALVDGVGSSTPDGFRIPTRKLTLTGQGIDTARFRPPAEPVANSLVVSVGRFSPIKDHETLLDAVATLSRGRGEGVGPIVELIGGAHSAAEERYLARLRDRAARLGIAERVRFVAGVPHAGIVPSYRRAALFASCSRTGSLDKAVLEAAACGVVPLVCNVAFRELLGPSWPELSFGPGDGDALARRLDEWLGRPAEERRSLGRRLRAIVEQRHSVDHLADAVVGMIAARARRDG
jgi:glycosyltransferase involved in cell wall biosynthesis